MLFSLFLSLSFQVIAGPKITDCDIDYRTATSYQANTGALLIDTRSPGQYEKYFIPGAINLPAYQIYGKSYLRNKRIILVAKGPESLHLYKKCIELRKAGFNDVFVLDGGMYAWIKSGGTLNVGAQAMGVYYVDAGEIVSDSGYRDYIMVNYSTKQPPQSFKQYVSSVKTIQKRKNLGKELSRLNENKIILAVDDNKLLHRFENMVRNKKDKQIVLLKGGITAYRKYYAKYKAMLAKDEFKLQGLQSCTN